MKAGQQTKPAPFTLTLQSKKSVSRVPPYSTSLLTPLSPPTQLLAATLSPHHCQCHCHHHAQHAPTLPLTSPGPRGSSCRLFWDTAVELSGESKPCSPAAGDPLDSGLFSSPRQPDVILQIPAFRNPATPPTSLRPGASPERQAGLWIGAETEWAFSSGKANGWSL